MSDEIVKIEQRAQVILNEARDIEITSPEIYLKTIEYRKNNVKTWIKATKEFFAPTIKKAHEAHKSAKALENSQVHPVEEADRILGKKIVAWDNQVREAARVKQIEADRKARAEEDRLRKIKDEQERKWREKEEAKQAEADRLKAEGNEEAARKAQAEADKAAEKAEERAEEKDAIFVQSAEVNVAAEPEGVHWRNNWKVKRIVDIDKIPRKFLMVDESKLNKFAKALGTDAEVSGVEFFNDRIQVGR